jgi:DNA-binding transcriptional LysR family regulator
MSALPDLADIRLVDAIAVTGSIGAAAAGLHVSQPSASQRLAVLERRLGVILVDRDTTGARLTPAGEAFLEPARRALALLEEAVVSARSPAGRHLSVGTIGSLASAVFPALLAVVPDIAIREVTDHGAVLARGVADGALDACVIGLDPAASPARGAVRTKLGVDTLVLVQPVGVELGSGSGRTSGATVLVATYSDDAAQVAERLARSGATTRISNGTLTALAMARQQGWLAAVPRTTALPHLRDGERIWRLRIRLEAPLWLVTRGRSAEVLREHAHTLAHRIGLGSRGAAW